MADKIIIKDLLLQGIIGVNDSERVKNQNIYVTVVMYTDFTTVGESDAIGDTVNYAWVAKELEKLVKDKKAKTLEHLAVTVASWLIALDGVQRCKVEIAKPSAITLAKSATVKIDRRRADLPPTRRPFAQASALAPALIYPPHAITPLYTSDQRHSISSNAGCVGRATARLNHSLVWLALGSNLGHRAHNIESAIEQLKAFSSIEAVSFLYETPAQYVADQPPFLNAAVQVQTNRSPEELLTKLKDIERTLGRNKEAPGAVRYGPRAIDLDIVFYAHLCHQTSILTIPHPQLQERDFVLGPLMDICPDYEHPTLKCTVRQLFNALPSVNLQRVTPIRMRKAQESAAVGSAGEISAEVLLPVGPSAPTTLMAVLNTTPDSFSDGGDFVTVEAGLGEIGRMVAGIHRGQADSKKDVLKGRFVVDIGGESSRPGATPVGSDVEVARVVPLITAIRKSADQTIKDVFLSVDTMKPSVALAAIQAGANLINDVTGGQFKEGDGSGPSMFDLALRFRVPIVLMHTRGTPQTMAGAALYVNTKPVIETVAEELRASIGQALARGVFPWQIITDPGIGFAKNAQQNIELLRDLGRWRSLVGGFGVLVGASRKKFIGDLTDRSAAKDRTFGTAAVVASSIASGANIVRVHDAEAMCDVVLVADALYGQ